LKCRNRGRVQLVPVRDQSSLGSWDGAEALVRTGKRRYPDTRTNEPKERGLAPFATRLLSCGVGVFRRDLSRDELPELGYLRDLEARELISNLDCFEAAGRGLVCIAKSVEFTLDARSITHIAARGHKRSSERVK
jgi:hypothetical protein